MTAAQRKAVEIEYGMKEGKLKFTVNRAFLLYALRRLGLDVPEDARPAGARRLKLLDRARIPNGGSSHGSSVKAYCQAESGSDC